MHLPKTAHATAFVIPVEEHWLEQEIAKWVHHEGLILVNGVVHIKDV